MRVRIRRTTGWPASSLALASKRFEFALARFAGRIRSLSLRLTDLNGPRGGLDKKCLTTVRLNQPPREIVIEEVGAHHLVVLGRAADRAARAVARAIACADERPLRQRG